VVCFEAFIYISICLYCFILIFLIDCCRFIQNYFRREKSRSYTWNKDVSHTSRKAGDIMTEMPPILRLRLWSALTILSTALPSVDIVRTLYDIFIFLNICYKFSNVVVLFCVISCWIGQ
jgi:hypothetical protein